MDTNLKEYNSDGCTGVPDFDFRPCCEAHDLEYEMPWVRRKQADLNLKRCIAKKHPIIAWVYYLGVRSFGWMFKTT